MTTDPRKLAKMVQRWGIICNAGQGDWGREHLDWQDAAKRFRTNYFAALKENHGKQ